MKKQRVDADKPAFYATASFRWVAFNAADEHEGLAKGLELLTALITEERGESPAQIKVQIREATLSEIAQWNDAIRMEEQYGS